LLKRVVIIAGIAVIALMGLFAILYNRRKKARFDSEVMEVEMKALRAQMNPHFISNSLHSINKYVMENDKNNASAYLAKFASLMRLILENSREREVPLEQDLHALELYMQLELLRFNNSFTYHIQVDPLIDPENTLIPPMLLQPFAENAILHGLHNKENGIINIHVRKVNEMISCVVEDNGNGDMEEPSMGTAESKQHKSLGKKIITERLNIINRLKKAKATLNIFQLKDAENKPGGVRVELLLPIELAF
jgi:sensor histidine kinase YesM